MRNAKCKIKNVFTTTPWLAAPRQQKADKPLGDHANKATLILHFQFCIFNFAFSIPLPPADADTPTDREQ